MLILNYVEHCLSKCCLTELLFSTNKGNNIIEPFLDKVGAHLDSYCVSAFKSLQMIRDNNKHNNYYYGGEGRKEVFISTENHIMSRFNFFFIASLSPPTFDSYYYLHVLQNVIITLSGVRMSDVY